MRMRYGVFMIHTKALAIELHGKFRHEGAIPTAQTAAGLAQDVITLYNELERSERLRRYAEDELRQLKRNK